MLAQAWHASSNHSIIPLSETNNIIWLVVSTPLKNISQLGRIIPYTSSTAQGGGGSFKNRKPIGEVGCCESRMAERNHWWTDRWLRSPLFLSLSSTYLPTYLSMHLSIYLSVCLSVSLSIYLQAWKRSYSARLPQFLNLTTSKTQQFSETASIFALDNIKNEAILRDFLFLKLTTWKTKQFCEASFKNGKLSAELTASYQCVLRFVQSICLNYCACHEKVMPGHTKCCTCHAKSSQQTWRSEAPKCNPSPEISARTS